MGYIYVTDVLLITGPAGLIMGFYANGGTTSRIAFVMLAVLWLYFTAMALIKAKQKDFRSHRNYMIRSYALTLSALTLRAWKYGITNTMDVRPMDVYRVVAWAGWVINLGIAEIIIQRTKKRMIKKDYREMGKVA
jgi:putative Mn2+ efflux pump MntP